MYLISNLLGKKGNEGWTIWRMVAVCAGERMREWGAGELASEGIR